MSSFEQIPTMAEHLGASVQVTRQVMARVTPQQAHDPTPCPEYDVARLLDHMVGWATTFADRVEGVVPAADPDSSLAGPDAAESYAAQADRMVDGYHASDRAPREGAVSVGVVLVETIVHGWDLATATGQGRPPYPVDAVEAALASGQAMLRPEYRGPDQAFGAEVPVSLSAPVLDRLVGFMGRDPAWRPPLG